MKKAVPDEKGQPRMMPGRSTLALLLAGTGLLVLGIVSWYAASQWRAEQALQPTDFSAVPVPVNFAAPQIALKDLDGATRSLSELRGQVILVNLWATWCPPCQAEMPLFQKFYEEHRAEGFTIAAIEDGEPEADVRAFATKYQLSFPIWLDPAHEATDHAFKTINLPTSYVIDRSGVVRMTWVGAIGQANLEKYVTPMIREK